MLRLLPTCDELLRILLRPKNHYISKKETAVCFGEVVEVGILLTRITLTSHNRDCEYFRAIDIPLDDVLWHNHSLHQVFIPDEVIKLKPLKSSSTRIVGAILYHDGRKLSQKRFDISLHMRNGTATLGTHLISFLGGCSLSRFTQKIWRSVK